MPCKSGAEDGLGGCRSPIFRLSTHSRCVGPIDVNVSGKTYVGCKRIKWIVCNGGGRKQGREADGITIICLKYRVCHIISDALICRWCGFTFLQALTSTRQCSAVVTDTSGATKRLVLSII